MDGEFLWVVIRQDDSGNRYRVGRYATREEAERVADRFNDQQLYLVEKIDQRQAS